MNRLHGKLSYANVISTLCLCLLVGGGTAFAATQMLPKNSVGAKQLKKNSVTAAKIKKGAITGPKIKLSTLGTVPSATSASVAAKATVATTALSADALSPLEVHTVGAAGQPPFLGGSGNFESGSPGLNFPPVSFAKDHDGYVHLEGLAKTGGSGSDNKAIFQLPPGFRPQAGITQIYEVGSSELFVFGSGVTIDGEDLAGDVYFPEGQIVSLSGISFLAGS